MAKNFVSVKKSLVDLLGLEYVRSSSAAGAFLNGGSCDELIALGREKVDFYPQAAQLKMAALLGQVGEQVIDRPLRETTSGAGSNSFNGATSTAAAPLSARGYYRIGEDGRLYLITKSEHYHAPLGHSFPGYQLIDKARSLGVPNATHNNTRGYITRRLEEELIRTANGLEPGDQKGLTEVLERTDHPYVLNRVINLETGSLAVEAALKMILARFYRMESQMTAPRYEGRTPVILVMGNDDGDLQANYHGTTVLTQMMRGMWPGMRESMQRAGLWKVLPIRPNRREDVDRAFAEYDTGQWKIAGFFHEIIMMNYGARRLTSEFLHYAHQWCGKRDVPTVVDEIQSCMWSPDLYLFREYGLQPSFVAVGKGFPGGEYPASRILFSAAMDVMPQFGALVTNGQEELASLAYLVTMEWTRANSIVIAELGAEYRQRLQSLADRYPSLIDEVEGWNHLSSLQFHGLDQAKRFTTMLNQRGFDISAQTYKADCPPVVLTKLPLLADGAVIEHTVSRMEQVLRLLVD